MPSHLVPDDRADPAVVHRIVCLEVEKWRLENRGGEDDLVSHGVVVSVDRLGRHTPLLGVDGFADLGELKLAFGDERARDVADEIVLDDRHA